MNSLVPELSVKDLNRSLEFYIGLLQFNLDYQRVEDKFAMISIDDCQIMIEEMNGHWQTGELIYPFGRGVNFQMIVKNNRVIYERLVMKNVPIMVDMKENWYRANTTLVGQKEFLVADPDGYLLRFVERLGERELVSGKK
ncbi:VOC family protein [Alkalihalobacillus sp. LMS6]|uniref:bleomycin resistance protein n=1 Tax=Bacillaceae TaxID=186817 RepID=UPI0020D091E4|nr:MULTISPECIES: VOC family protein [Bacillaceae]UTR07101.1 VOC family protein [Alkalihalobacillus sp. LMS6]